MTFTKISGAILAAFLIIMGVKEISHLIYHPHELEEPAYPIEVPENLGAAGAEEEAPLNLGLMLANADVAAGEQAVRKCAACHTFEEGGGTLTGPNQYGIVGAPSAADPNFNYSTAMQEFGEPWTYENLNHFLENPRGFIQGTAMSFAGLRDDEERVNVLAYLASITPDAPPFPEPLPEEEEAAEGEAVAAAEGETAEGEAAEGGDAGAEPAVEGEDAVPNPTLESSEEIDEETAEAADAAEAGEAAAGEDSAQPAEDSAGGEAGTAESPTQRQETGESAEQSEAAAEAAAEDQEAQPE